MEASSISIEHSISAEESKDARLLKQLTMNNNTITGVRLKIAKLAGFMITAGHRTMSDQYLPYVRLIVYMTGYNVRRMR